MGKLTPNFADTISSSPTGDLHSEVATFPASRVMYEPQQGMLSPYVGMGQFGQPAAQTRRWKVAIIGTAPSSRSVAPYDDLSWDIWGCSPGNMNCIPRVDAWFEIHANLLWPKYIDLYGKNYIKWLSEQKFPVYLQDESWHPKYFPHALKFPAHELVKKFGRYWFNSSFAWMTAFAIHLGYKEIGLFGVDMASKDEYFQQRLGFYHWLDKAKDLGIKMTIPRESDLAQPPGLYGYSDNSPFGRKLHARNDELEGRSEGLNQEIQKGSMQLDSLKNNKLYIDGAREDVQYLQSIWPAVQDEWGEVPLDAALETVRAAGYSVVDKQKAEAALQKAEESLQRSEGILDRMLPEQPPLKESNNG